MEFITTGHLEVPLELRFASGVWVYSSLPEDRFLAKEAGFSFDPQTKDMAVGIAGGGA